MCRRAGISLCGRKKCASLRRNFAPGVHGPQRRPRLTPYAVQLREKQNAKHLYGVQERQFRKYFETASRSKGDTAELLVQALEMRLDNVVFRTGLATNRFQARQLVGHGHVTVNGKRVDIPSFRVRPGELIGLSKKMQASKLIQERMEDIKNTQTPSWLALDADQLVGKVVSAPTGEDLRQVFDPKVIVEFYSR